MGKVIDSRQAPTATCESRLSYEARTKGIEVGVFHTNIGLANLTEPMRRIEVEHVMVDTGSEATWVHRDLLRQAGVEPNGQTRRFQLADGSVVERPIGFAYLYVDGVITVDVVVFAEPGELQLLGARALEGLNLIPDVVNKQFVQAGPAPAAGSSING